VGYGKLIKAARLRLKLSQEELARRVDVTKGAISQWETETGAPSRANARKVARELGISADELEARLMSGLNLLDSLPSGREIPLLTWEQLYQLQRGTGRLKGKLRADGPGSGGSIVVGDVDTPVDAVAASVADQSMEPEFHVGDVIVFSKSVSPRSDGTDYVVAVVGQDQVVLRRYTPRGKNRQGFEVFDLVSSSPDFETIPGNSATPVTVLGTVVEHRKRRQP